MSPSKLVRFASLILAGLCGCSLELPGAGTEWEQSDAGGVEDAGDLLDAEAEDADVEDAALDAQGVDAARDAGGDEQPVDAETDAASPCGSAALGAVEERVRYAAAQVIAPAGCVSETQRRTCGASGWSSWSGSYQSEQCSVTTYRSCGAVLHGAAEQRTRYVVALASSSAGCLSQQQSRICNDGTFGAWSGTYQYSSCAVALQGSCALDSQVACQQGTTCSAAQGQPLKCLGATGFACSADTQCVATCIGGLCAAKSQPGGACESVADCAGCSDGAAVDCLEGTCRCGDGAECSENEQCKGTCVDESCASVNAECDEDDDCRDGRECFRKSGEDMCLLPTGSACEANAECERVCRTDKCSATGMTGDTCDENDDCLFSLVCRAQQCGARGTLGQVCDESADCGTGLACATLTQLCLKANGQSCTLPIECASGRCMASGSGSGTCF